MKIFLTKNIHLLLSIIFLWVGLQYSFANNLNISNPSFDESNNELSFDLSWQNAWHTATGNDGVWVFVKYAANGSSNWMHADIILTSVALDLSVNNSGENKGTMLIPNSCIGATNCNISNQPVTLTLDNLVGTNFDFKIFGIEMVLVKSSPFYVGDGVSPNTMFTQPDTLTPYYVNSEQAISVGLSPGELNKDVNILGADIPFEYPKGYRPFWAMKYKVSMAQYVAFLNTLSRTQQNSRTATDLTPATITNVFVMTETPSVLFRHPIRCDQNQESGPIHFYCDLNENGLPNENDDGQNLIMHHINKGDVLAYLDWAAMRPLSHMEFEKMSRGPVFPVAGEFAWGTSGHINAGNLLNTGMPNETFDNIASGPIWPAHGASSFVGARTGFAATSSSDRLQAGATYYGIMDVHSGGNVFIGESNTNLVFHYYNDQGDGHINILGDSDVPNWSNLDVHYNMAHFYRSISNGELSNLLDGRYVYTSCRGALRLFP